MLYIVIALVIVIVIVISCKFLKVLYCKQLQLGQIDI